MCKVSVAPNGQFVCCITATPLSDHSKVVFEFYIKLASVPALSCRCMTYAYLNSYVSYVFYSYSYMPASNLLWLPAVYHAYL